MNDSFYSNPLIQKLQELQKNMQVPAPIKQEDLAEIIKVDEELHLQSKIKRSKNQRVFLVLSLAMAVLAAVSVLYNLDILNDQDPIIGFTVLTGMIATIFSMFTLQAEPAKKIREKLKKINSKIINPKPSFKGLRRSKEDRVIFGVAGGIARFFGVDSTFIRIPMMIGLFASFGSLILFYIGLSFIIKPEE